MKHYTKLLHILVGVALMFATVSCQSNNYLLCEKVNYQGTPGVGKVKEPTDKLILLYVDEKIYEYKRELTAARRTGIAADFLDDGINAVTAVGGSFGLDAGNIARIGLGNLQPVQNKQITAQTFADGIRNLEGLRVEFIKLSDGKINGRELTNLGGRFYKRAKAIEHVVEATLVGKIATKEESQAATKSLTE